MRVWLLEPRRICIGSFWVWVYEKSKNRSSDLKSIFPVLGIILAILLASILMLAIVRWFVSRRRKKDKDEEDEQRIVGSAASGYQQPGAASVVGSGYPASAIDLDLPPATTLDDRDRVAYWY